MKNFDFLLSEVIGDDVLLDKPRIFSIVSNGNVYRVVVRSASTLFKLSSFQIRYKKYPSPGWFQSEALFELTHCQPSLF